MDNIQVGKVYLTYYLDGEVKYIIPKSPPNEVNCHNQPYFECITVWVNDLFLLELTTEDEVCSENFLNYFHLASPEELAEFNFKWLPKVLADIEESQKELVEKINSLEMTKGLLGGLGDV